MNLLLLGGSLLFVGVVLLAIYRSKTRNVTQRADRGGVVVGETNSGVIITGEGNTTSVWMHAMQVIGIIATVVGALLSGYQIFFQGNQ